MLPPLMEVEVSSQDTSRHPIVSFIVLGAKMCKNNEIMKKANK